MELRTWSPTIVFVANRLIWKWNIQLISQNFRKFTAMEHKLEFRKICLQYFTVKFTFRGCELWFLWFFALLMAVIYQINKIETPLTCKKDNLKLLDSRNYWKSIFTRSKTTVLTILEALKSNKLPKISKFRAS